MSHQPPLLPKAGAVPANPKPASPARQTGTVLSRAGRCGVVPGTPARPWVASAKRINLGREAAGRSGVEDGGPG